MSIPRCNCRMLARWAGILSLFAVAGGLPVAGTEYFVRQDGDDAAHGDSPKAAWRTIERVNQTHLHPGDQVRFESGQSFSGNLRLTAEDTGTTEAPVLITSSGEGAATLLAGSTNGVTVENAAGCAIENLVIVGSGRTNNTGSGILCENTAAEFKPLNGLRIANVDVSGFGRQGILVTGEHGGFHHVTVTNCELHDNLRGGMEISGRLPYDSPQYAHADVKVTHCRAFNNTGDPAYLKNHSGSGIALYQVDGGIMEHCVAWNNGALCRSRTGGGVGLWTCASRKVVIQNCESFANKTSHADGGGFDIDGGSEDCVLQYNYSHDNDGPGLMVYTYPYAPHADRGNIVRYNISEDDSRKSRKYAGLWVRNDGKGMTGVEIYNNTVQVGPWADQAAFVHGDGVEAHLRNNIFVGHGTAVPVRVDQPKSAVHFENNLYWRDGAPFEINWDGHAYASLGEWRTGTGQELLDGGPTGCSENPVLSTNQPQSRAVAQPALPDLRAFRPMPDSPALKRGLDLRNRFGLETGAQDFLGLALPVKGNSLLGAVSAPFRD